MLLLFVTTLFLIIQFSITTGAGAGLICVVWNNYKPFTGVLRAFNTLRYNLSLFILKSIYGAVSGVIWPFMILYASRNHGNTGRPDGSATTAVYNTIPQNIVVCDFKPQYIDFCQKSTSPGCVCHFQKFRIIQTATGEVFIYSQKIFSKKYF